MLDPAATSTNTTKALQLEVKGAGETTPTCYDNFVATVASYYWLSIPGTYPANTKQLNAGQASFKIVGLRAGVKVDRVVATISKDCIPGNSLQGGVAGNNCASPSDIVAPTVNITSPSSGSTITNNTVSVSANASDVTPPSVDTNTSDSGVARVEFYLAGTLISTQVNAPYSENVDISNKGIPDGQGLPLEARAFDNSGNQSSATITVNVQNADTEKPSPPPNAAATANAYNRVTVTWGTSTDNVAVTGYYVYQGVVLVGQVGPTVRSFPDTTVSGNTTYSYSVRAFDAAGNTSYPSNTATVTTPSPPDTTAPSAPTNLTLTPNGTNGIDMTWDASTDNVGGGGVAAYDIYRKAGSEPSFTKIATVLASSPRTFGDTGLAASTTYTYYIIARDAAGNPSQPSTSKSYTMPAPPPTDTGIVAARIRDAANKSFVPPGAYIQFTVGGSVRTYSADQSQGWIYVGLPVGNYTFTLGAPNYQSEFRNATIYKDQTTSLKQVLLRRL